MSGIHESCTVCARTFEVQFRYQMEERDGGFAFFCSQECLRTSHAGGADGHVTCDACARRFEVELALHVLYVRGARRHACSMDCRAQLLREGSGARLGEIAEGAPVARAEASASAPGSSQLAAPAADVAPSPVARRAADTRKPHVVAVFNHKGGTGKTTTSVSLAAGLAMRGMRVLVVDTDSQGNVGVSLGVKSQRSLYHVLVMGLAPEQAITNVRPNLDVLPSNETLAAAELYLAGRQQRDRVLAQRLSRTAGAYDVVVVDCSPSLSLLNQNALVLADSLLVPVACDYLSLVGVRQVIKTVKNVNKHLGHGVAIWGVLPTLYDARAKICREALETMAQHFGDRCLSPIRAAIKVKEAPAQGSTIFEHAPGSSAAEDYLKLVDRLVAEKTRDGAGVAASA